jgi:winged helix DNA-binding protein
VAAADIGLLRLASQRIAGGRLEQPADVVRWLGAIQAQDYGQSLWAIGARLRAGTLEQVEGALADRQIVRTWLMRGTIHFAPPEDVRWLLALVAPRPLAADERRCARLGLTAASIARSAELLNQALAGDRRLSRPEVMDLLEGDGIETGGGRGYHILWRLALDGLICGGPIQGKQQTFVLLDDWAPRPQSLDLSREQALAVLAGRFVASRGPVTDHDLARWAGITLGDARNGLRAACEPALAARSFDGVEYWIAADQVDETVPAAGHREAFLLPGFDEYMLGYKDRDAVIAREHAGKVVPGANGVFRPIIVAGGQIVGTWSRTARAQALTITLQPFTAPGKLADQVRPEANRYRAFLGLPSTSKPILRSESLER